MAKSKRAQILMDPEFYERLEAISRVEGKSVEALIREAAEEKYCCSPNERKETLEGLFSLDIPVSDWEEIDAEISEAHDAGVS